MAIEKRHWSAESTPILASQKVAAESWLKKHGDDAEVFRRLPAAEVAKRLSYATYNFCEPGTGTFHNASELYDKCSTQCAGFAQFYRGLAEVVGLNTRLVNIYDIPFQGNHTAVEVQLPHGKWGFIDPTFGAFFSADGRADGNILSFAEVHGKTDVRELKKRVVQAKRGSVSLLMRPLNFLFSGKFEHAGMPIENYQEFEAVSHDKPQELVVLQLPLAAKGGSAEIGDLHGSDINFLQRAWQEVTAASLRSPDINSHISFDTAYLSNGREDTVTLLTLADLKPKAHYHLYLRMVNQYQFPQLLQVASIGHVVDFESDHIQTVRPGISTLHVEFVARRARGEIYLHNLESTSLLEMYAAKLVSSGSASDTETTSAFHKFTQSSSAE